MPVAALASYPPVANRLVGGRYLKVGSFDGCADSGNPCEISPYSVERSENGVRM